jgi:hypothetical protein
VFPRGLNYGADSVFACTMFFIHTVHAKPHRPGPWGRRLGECDTRQGTMRRKVATLLACIICSRNQTRTVRRTATRTHGRSRSCVVLGANSLYATGKYIHSLYATDPTCHRHQKIYLYATQWHTRDEYKI